MNKCFYLLYSDPVVVLDSDDDEDQPVPLDKRPNNFNISHSSIGRYFIIDFYHRLCALRNLLCTVATKVCCTMCRFFLL